jgi:hypothetical protein
MRRFAAPLTLSDCATLALLAAFLNGCTTLSPEAKAIHVIGGLSAAPVGCQDLGPVALPPASTLTTSPVGSPNDEMMRTLAAAKGADTLHYTGAFPLKGEAYKCGPMRPP